MRQEADAVSRTVVVPALVSSARFLLRPELAEARRPDGVE